MTTLRRLALLLGLVACLVAGLLWGATRSLATGLAVGAYRWLARVIPPSALMVLAVACNAPRMTSGPASLFAGQDHRRAMPTAASCRESAAASHPAWGRRMECSVLGMERELEAPIWRVMAADGAILSVTRAAVRVPVWLPQSAARIELWVATGGTSAAGQREWRLVYSYLVGAVEAPPAVTAALP